MMIPDACPKNLRESELQGSKSQPQSYRELLSKYEETEPNFVRGEILEVKGVGQKDVYNISAPIKKDGNLYLLGRVEPRGSEKNSISCFFIYEPKDNSWWLAKDLFYWSMQDPFLTTIKNRYVLNGVIVTPSRFKEGELEYKTVFFQGSNFKDFRKFTEGPRMMKNIRLVELADKKIGVFTRPQGEKAGRGKIGFTVINSLEDLNQDVISKARIIENQFKELEWGGVDNAYLLKDGRIGVLGHIASMELDGSKHYAAMVFEFNPKDFQFSNMRIVALRKDFPPGPAKRPELEDIIMPGGLQKIENEPHYLEKVQLYCGLSDTQAGKIEILNPFGRFW